MQQQPLDPAEWKVEHEKDVVFFKDFASALSYAEDLVFEKHLVKVIDPPENKIQLIPDYYQPQYK